MPSKVPLTNLRDSQKGGAPLYVGGDRLVGELLTTPPYFLDDSDQYFQERYTRRGLKSIVHIPPGGSSTVDFVTLFMRNNSTTERAFVNIYLGSDISVEMRTAGIQSSSPIYGDVLLIEANGDSEITSTISEENEISISVVTSDKYDISLIPTVEFSPPINGNMSSFVTLASSGMIESITVLNATSHAYTEPPLVRIIGGVIKPLGFFEYSNDNTKVLGSNVAGAITVIGTLCRTEFASNVNQPGDVILLNNEVRVVQSVNTDTKEFNIDSTITGSQSIFDEWSYISLLSASSQSYYRLGSGTLNNQPSLGANGLMCNVKHNLSHGDYVIYTSTSGVYVSKRVIAVIDEYQFRIDDNCSLTANSNSSWKFVYLYSQTSPGSTQLEEVNTISYVKIADANNSVVDLIGLGGRKIFLQNYNFMNRAGSYFDPTLLGEDRVVDFCKTATAHNDSREIPHEIDPSTVLEIELKPQPAPEVQVLAGFPLNGGSATETGKRPLIATHQRGIIGKSTQVVYWGYYMRYSPESNTNYTQAINV